MVNKLNLINQHLSSSDIDLLFLSESWLTPKISDCMVCPPGYDIIRQDRQDPNKSRGGGVCVLYKSFLNVKEIRSNIRSDNKYEYVCIDLYQCFSTGVPRHTGVPRAIARCAASFYCIRHLGFL
jgi:hypothetical protein